MLLLQDAEFVFNDEIFTPEINSHLVDDDAIGDKAQSGSTAKKISPGLKRKVVTEAAKNERCVTALLHFQTNAQSARVKRAKDLSASRMVPTMKKPSGARSGWTPLTTAPTRTEPLTVIGEDGDETDQGGEEESEDIKPPGRLIRTSSVGHTNGTPKSTNIIQSRPSSLSPL